VLEGHGYPAVTGGPKYLALTFLVPGVDVRCTQGAFPPVSGRARPPRGRGGWRWGCVAVHRHVRRGLAARGISGLDPDAVPALAGGTALAALTLRRAGRLPVPCARAGPLPAECAAGRATARQAPGRRGSVGGRAHRACPRPAPGSPGFATGGPGLTRAASGRVAGAGTVRGAGRPFGRIREPAPIPLRWLIRVPISTPPEGGVPSRR